MAAPRIPSIWDLPEVDEELLQRDLAEQSAAEDSDDESDGAPEDPDSAAEDPDSAEEDPDTGMVFEQPEPIFEQPGPDPVAEQPALAPIETSVHTVWGRMRAGNGPTFREVKDVLEKIPDKVTIAAIDGEGYSGHAKHEDVMGQLLEMPDVCGIVRVMRRLKGDHTLWCFFKADGTFRVLRTGRPEGFLGIAEPIFEAPCRGKDHPDGYMSNHCFLACSELGKGRPNFVDYVESLL